jgi:hypothetical protein
VTYRVAEGIAVGRAEPRPRHGWVADAPADLDRVMATVPVMPRWVGLVLALGASLGLWAVILVAARWALRALI